jgi:serine/threonine protein kinase/tetratricopeptide (TPR) repeat protein
VDDSEQVDEILAEWRLAHEKGIAGTPESVIRQHPELADALRRGFALLHALDAVLAGDRPPPDPVLSRLGPYRIDRKIGQGGMGTVYRATVEEEGRGLVRGDRVAVKVIHPHLLGREGFFKRFLREAQLGRQVRHENVVRTLDVDAVQSGPQTLLFLVMEHVQGRTLKRLLQDLGTVPEALLREIASQAAAGLEAIHGAGIIHRDLKPENLIITDDHRIRIMDLGVARVRDESMAITREGQFAGSLLYAAPEQIRQKEIGSAADLYALGVLLYELGTGENPFRGDDAAAMMHAHLEEIPPRADERNPDLSPFAGELIAALLAKDPGQRPESATELRKLLEAGEESTWWSARQRLLRERRPRIPVRKETNLYGRDTELELLRQCWERARTGDGNTLLLEGEAGIGKTRLVDAFLQDLDGQARVLYGSYPPAGGMGGISDAILAEFGTGDAESALRPYLTATPSLVAPFAAVLKHEAPPPGGPTLAGDALHAVCVHLMRALAVDKPLLWVLEDLHFAEADSRVILVSLARAVEGHPILLLATTRPGIPGEELAQLSRQENFRRADLGRLSAREVVLLLQDAFRSEALADKLGARIALKSDGIPFFVFEMIRGLKEGQFITELPDGSFVESKVIENIEVPSAVKDLIEARLRGLSDEERAILDLGAVQGFEFDPDMVAAVRRRDRVFVLERLAAVERRSGVVRAADRRYRFDHHQIQEVLYAQLSRSLREEYHLLLARAFADRVGDPPDGESAYFLASHHLRGSRPREGLPHLVPALDQLAKHYRSEAAIELATRALDTPKLLEGKERVEVLLQKAARHDLRAERGIQRAVLDEALAGADSSGDAALRARVRGSLGWHFCQTSDYGAAWECAEQALHFAREAADKKAETAATGQLALVSGIQGRYDEARAHHAKHLALAREIGDRRSEAIATGNLGLVLLCLGRYEEARAHFEQPLTFAREIGDRLGEAGATVNLGIVSLLQGRHEEARVHLENGLTLSREIGHRQFEANAAVNLGIVLLQQGRYEKAIAHFGKHVALVREIGDRAGEGVNAGNLGFALLSLGRYEEARAHFEKSLTLAHEIGDRRSEGEALEGLAIVAEQRGEIGEARRFCEEALGLRRQISHTAGVTSTLITLGRLKVSQAEEQAAIAHLEEALSLAEELQEPDRIVSAAVEKGRLPGGDAATTLAALAEYGDCVAHGTRMNAHFRIWEVTKDKTHLAEAKQLLDFAVEHAPEECRTSMIENVPLHRDIMKAWTEHGEKGA